MQSVIRGEATSVGLCEDNAVRIVDVRECSARKRSRTERGTGSRGSLRIAGAEQARQGVVGERALVRAVLNDVAQIAQGVERVGSNPDRLTRSGASVGWRVARVMGVVWC